MCAVSMVSDWYNDDWWRRQREQPKFPVPSPLPQAAPVKFPWDEEALKMLKEIMETMKQLDAKLGIPDCEDPAKAKWLKSVERKVKRKKQVP